jgi:hypothetical protein
MSVKSVKIINTEQLAEDIKSCKYKIKKKLNLIQFFKQLSNGDYVPDDTKRIQVRELDRNLDFIDRIVTKLSTSKNYKNLDTIVVVYFPKTDEYKIISGNHTSEIMIRLRIFDANVYVVDFETQLGGLISNIIDLGCLLNKVEKEVQPVSVGDVKNLLYQHMKEREDEGLDPTPTQEYREELVRKYPHVSQGSIGQWISNHQVVGGRRDPIKSWRQQELEDEWNHFKNNYKYQDHVVIKPRSIEAWNQTAISTLIIECQRQNKRKALLIFFCENAAQVLTFTSSDRSAKMKELYKDLSDFYNIQIEMEFLRFQ